MVKMRAVLRSLKVLLLTICIVAIIGLTLVVGGASFLLSDRGNEWARAHLQTYLAKKFRTRVTIGRLYTTGINSLTISDFVLSDQEGRHLLSLKRLSAEIQLGFLFKGSKSIFKSIDLIQLQSVFLHKKEQQNFNYQFLLDALGDGNKADDHSESGIAWLIPERITIRQLSVIYDDEKQNDKATIYLATLRSNLHIVDEIIPAQWVLEDFLLDSAKVNITSGNYRQEKQVTDNHDISPWPQLIQVSKAEILHSGFRMENSGQGLSVNSTLGRFFLRNGYYSAPDQKISAGLIIGNDHFTAIKTKSGDQTNNGISGSKSEQLTIKIDTLLINRNRFSLNITDRKKYRDKRFDAYHNDYKNISISATNLKYNEKEIGGIFGKLSLSDSRDFKLQIAAKISVTDTVANVNNFSVITKRNNVHGSADLHYDSMQKLLSDPLSTRFAAKLDANVLNLLELTYFLPVLLRYEEIKPLYKQNIKAKFSARGTPENIRLDNYDIRTNHNRLVGKGEIHVPENSNTWLKLDVSSATTGKNGLNEILAKGVLNDNIFNKIPRFARLKGNILITSKELRPDLSLISDIGRIHLKGTLHSYTDINRIAYDVDFHSKRLLLGKLVGDTLLGPFSFRSHVTGTGLSDLQRMKFETTGFADIASVSGIPFRSISFKGSLKDGQLYSNIGSQNPDLSFDLSPKISFNNNNQFLKVEGVINNVNLQQLGLVDDSLSISTLVTGELKKSSLDTLVGAITLSKIKSDVNGQTYEIDSVFLRADYQNGQQILSLRSPLADMDMAGRFGVTQIPAFLRNTGKAILFSEPFSDSLSVETLDAQGNVHIPLETQSMIAALDYVTPFQFRLHYDKSANSFDFKTDIDSVAAEKITVDSLHVAVQSRREPAGDLFTSYSFAAKSVIGKSVLLPEVSLTGSIREGIHDGLLSIASLNDDYFRIPYLFYARDKNPFLSIQDSLYLNGERWKVSEENVIHTNLKNFGGSRIGLRNGQKTLTFETNDTDSEGLPYRIKVANFDLETLFSLMKTDTSLLAGTANGAIVLKQLSPLGLTVNLGIQDLEVKKVPVGNLTTEIRSLSTDDYAVIATLDAGTGRLAADGKYNISQKTGDIDIDFNAMPIESLGEFVKSDIDSLKGSLSGRMKLSLDSTSTNINGFLNIDSTSFAVRKTGGQFHIVRGGLDFSGDKIVIRPIELSDRKDGHGTITGSVDASNFEKLSYRIKLETTKLNAISDLRSRQQLVYGEGKTSANLELNGNLKEYNLTGQISLDEDANIFYKNASVRTDDFGEGLLEFRQPVLSDGLKTTINGKASEERINGIINTNLTVPSGATLTLILDEYTGEKVVAHGKSNLNYSQHEGGETQLNGKYEVSSGTYTFSVGNNIRKEFSIDNGSTIQWQGDPNQPISDLTATYKVTTSAGMLLQGQSTDTEAGKKKFEFLVKLKLKGNIKKPEITFELDMNEKDQDAYNGVIYSKIKEINGEPSEVTKEVMSLLVLNSFMGDSPFGSLNQLSNTSLEIGAYNTIGNVLTTELNNMLAGMVKAVDITLGVNWSESAEAGRSSARSDIKLGLGKSLFHHRLNLYVGNNLGIETLSGANSGLSGLANDVSVEYLLNAEGKYRIKGYHIRDNALTLHGEHMETGVKFIIVWDFDSEKVFSEKRNHKNIAQ